MKASLPEAARGVPGYTRSRKGTLMPTLRDFAQASTTEGYAVGNSHLVVIADEEIDEPAAIKLPHVGIGIVPIEGKTAPDIHTQHDSRN